ncbi:MAG: 1,4-dihydroxy-6-naphtoate synthase, partial [uncultured Gemmatimonadetes bacterium]
ERGADAGVFAVPERHLHLRRAGARACGGGRASLRGAAGGRGDAEPAGGRCGARRHQDLVRRDPRAPARLRAAAQRRCAGARVRAARRRAPRDGGGRAVRGAHRHPRAQHDRQPPPPPLCARRGAGGGAGVQRRHARRGARRVRCGAHHPRVALHLSAARAGARGGPGRMVGIDVRPADPPRRHPGPPRAGRRCHPRRGGWHPALGGVRLRPPGCIAPVRACPRAGDGRRGDAAAHRPLREPLLGRRGGGGRARHRGPLRARPRGGGDRRGGTVAFPL